MNPSPQVELRPQSPVLIATTVVVNIIWWMVMVAAIGLGATHLSRCTIQPYIPIYLIVLGAVNLFALFMTYTKGTWEDELVSIMSSACTSLLHLFTFGWLIAGTAWIYPIYPPNYTYGAAPYCHKTTYQFAFVVTTLVWVTMTLVLVCGFCVALLSCCTTVFAGRRLIPNRYSFYGATSEGPTAGDV